MPTITVRVDDIMQLLGRTLTLDELENQLGLAKAELDAHDESTGELRIELNDTNRPDLWCAEGIARQIRVHLEGKREGEPLFPAREQPPTQVIEVDSGLEKVRPYVAAFSTQGPPVTDAFLVQIIQTQEKLCENYGRKRQNVAIGIYNADKIRFPVRFRAVGGNDCSYVPLGCEEAMTLEQIVEEHPKGKEYGHLVKGLPAYPLLVDADDRVLSFPPIINSRETGQVVVGDQHLFVEATGSDMRQLLLVMNIMAANFRDRGWKVEPVLTRLPYDSTLGREVAAPADLDTRISLELDRFTRILGEPFSPEEVVRVLAAYDVQASVEGDTLEAVCPPYRDDYMHAMDVVEDFAVSRGFDSFKPLMPSRFTVGKLKPITLLVDRLRNHMIGLGFEEIFSNILTNRTVERDWLGMPDEPIVTIDNVMTETYSVVRSSILPSLLRVEATSSKALYPHRLFEAGEVCVPTPETSAGTRTEMRVAALWAAADTGFSEIHSVLDRLLFLLAKEYELAAVNLPFYFEGRAGEVRIDGQRLGHVGEIHPAVLTRFNVTMPCAGFELILERI